MKKAFPKYCVIWAVMLTLFNAIAFLFVGRIWGETYTPSFWIGYGLITLTFIGQLICAFFALRETNLQKTFYSYPLFKTSYGGLIASFVFGGLCMVISPLPYWVSVILCAIVLAWNVTALLKASIAIDAVSAVDEKIKVQTAFICTMTAEAETLMSRAGTPEIKAECRKVYEALRYSDPMSNNALQEIDSQIGNQVAQMMQLVATADAMRIQQIGDEAIRLLKERNSRCKSLKQ